MRGGGGVEITLNKRSIGKNSTDDFGVPGVGEGGSGGGRTSQQWRTCGKWLHADMTRPTHLSPEQEKPQSNILYYCLAQPSDSS